MVNTSKDAAGREKNSKNSKRKVTLPVKRPAAGLGPGSAHRGGEGETPEENSAARRVDHTRTGTGKGKRPRSARVPRVRRQGRRRRRNAQTGTRRQRRPLKPGEGALREIRKLQMSTDLLISKLALSRLVREITQTVTKEPFRWTRDALGAIHEAVEAHAVKLFEKSQMAAIHAKRVTVMPKDIHHVHRILRE